MNGAMSMESNSVSGTHKTNANFNTKSMEIIKLCDGEAERRIPTRGNNFYKWKGRWRAYVLN